MKLLWAGSMDMVGPFYGVSVHAREMRRALATLGVELTQDVDGGATLAVHILPPDRFRPVPGMRNLLFTTTEADDVNVPLRARPDILVVPCEHNARAFRKHFDGPIFICPEGVDKELFPFHERTPPGDGEGFRFLWHGNVTDQSKGAGIAMSAWRTWLRSGRMPRGSTLTIHTTSLPAPLHQTYGELVGPPCLIIDNSNLPPAQLVELYNSSHVLITSTWGEGWNLVLCEAFASGLPAIWSHHTAMLDYCDDSIGFPILDLKSTPCWRAEREMDPRDSLAAAEALLAAGVPPDYHMLAPTDEAVIACMEAVVGDYAAALARARRASEKMHRSFSWPQAAEKFIAICEKCAGAGV